MGIEWSAPRGSMPDGAWHAVACPRLRAESDLSQDLAQGEAFALRIGNLQAIASVYGGDFADSVSSQVLASLQVFIASDPHVFGKICSRATGVFDLVLAARDSTDGVSRAQCRQKVAIWCSAIGRRALAFGARSVHVLASALTAGSMAGDQGVPGECLLAQAHARLECAQICAMARLDGFDGYQRDMAIVAELYEQLNRDQLQFAWKPVRHLENDTSLYYRGMLSALQADGGAGEWDVSRKAMHRLGLTAAFDQHALLQAIDLLAGSEVGPIAVAVAASSFQSLCWWEPVLARLRACRSLGRRLFIAIDGTCAFVSVSAAAALADELRALGCVIVFERMSNDNGSIASLLALRPDVITIEAMFLRLTLESARDLDLLRHLLGVAMAIAPVVVLEGVDTRALAKNAIVVGGLWGAGEHVGAARWILPRCPATGAAWHVNVDHFRRQLALPRYVGERA